MQEKSIYFELSAGMEVSVSEEAVIYSAFELGLVDDYSGYIGYIDYIVNLDDSTRVAYDAETLLEMFPDELNEKILIDIREAAADKLMTYSFENMKLT